jgi:hypothetical protein
MNNRLRSKILLILTLYLTSVWPALAQEASLTPTATATPTPSPTPVAITLTIYRDSDSLTLYVPATTELISLQDFAFQVTTFSGEQITQRIDRDFTAFVGMPFSNLTSLRSAICFRLIQSGRTPVAPQACQGTLALTQYLASADIFGSTE